MKQSEKITASILRKVENQQFFTGYEAAVDDLKNVLCNNLFDMVDQPCGLIIEDDVEFGGFKCCVKQEDYDKLSTLNKIKVEMFTKIANDILSGMVSFASECFDALQEGEAK